jgi:hypothetical protein
VLLQQGHAGFCDRALRASRATASCQVTSVVVPGPLLIALFPLRQTRLSSSTDDSRVWLSTLESKGVCSHGQEQGQ